MHLAAANLHLERPLGTPPPLATRVVEALVAVLLGMLDVILEAAVGGRHGPVLRAQVEQVVTQLPLATLGGRVGLVGGQLPRLEDDAGGDGIGNVQHGQVPRVHAVRVLADLEHLPPHRVRLLHPRRDAHVLDVLHERAILLHQPFHLVGDVVEDGPHALPDAVGVRAPAQRRDLGVRPGILGAEGGVLEFRLEAEHAQPGREGGVDVERLLGCAGLFGGRRPPPPGAVGGGREGAVGLESLEAVETRRGSDGQGPPVPFLVDRQQQAPQVARVGGAEPAE
mmetsp:Transcript_19286/g.31181  ORF Transcript_19286/g.31181 Transcript_19286/m.31181 type:complete len:281 (+) Transcript_19286:738-1580(+)